jgi:hypothetical protein
VLASRHAYAKVVTGLVINIFSHIEPDDPIRIVGRLSFPLYRPPFEYDYLVKLLSFGLVHVHHYDTALGLGAC